MKRMLGTLSFWLASLAVAAGAVLEYSREAPWGFILITLAALVYTLGAKLRYYRKRRYYY